MRVLFFGYSQIGARALELLHARGDALVGIVTHRDDPQENRWYETPAEVATRLGLDFRYDSDLATPGSGGLVELARAAAPELILSVLYRDLLPAEVLGLATRAALNLHPSLLPAYRGRAPLNWVLVNGERETGVTLHHMVARADAGDIVAQRRVAIAPRETALSLYRKLEEESVVLLREALPLVADGTAPRRPQDDSQASKFGRRRPEDGRIDWHWPAERVDRLVRAVAPPWPGAFFDLPAGRVFIHAGEPTAALLGDAAPGSVRRSGGALEIAAADRWFRVDAGVGLEHLHPVGA